MRPIIREEWRPGCRDKQKSQDKKSRSGPFEMFRQVIKKFIYHGIPPVILSCKKDAGLQNG
jgi:hypothetical protein